MLLEGIVEIAGRHTDPAMPATPALLAPPAPLLWAGVPVPDARHLGPVVILLVSLLLLVLR